MEEQEYIPLDLFIKYPTLIDRYQSIYQDDIRITDFDKCILYLISKGKVYGNKTVNLVKCFTGKDALQMVNHGLMSLEKNGYICMFRGVEESDNYIKLLAPENFNLNK